MIQLCATIEFVQEIGEKFQIEIKSLNFRIRKLLTKIQFQVNKISLNCLHFFYTVTSLFVCAYLCVSFSFLCLFLLFYFDFGFIGVWIWLVLFGTMLFASKKFHRKRAKKAKINPSVVVCSDEFLLVDLVEQFIGVWCCSMLTFAHDDTTDTTSVKTQPPNDVKKTEKY